MITVHAQKVVASINEIHSSSNNCLHWWGASRSEEHNLASTELLAQLLTPQTGTWKIGLVCGRSGRRAPTLEREIHTRMQQGQCCSYLSHGDLWNSTVSLKQPE